MRALGAAYTTALGQPVSRPVWRVLLANHGGVYADPLDITPWLATLELTRPLRQGNGATLALHSVGGQFDPISGVYALAVQPGVAEVRIELGEVLAGVPTYWRVMTGQVYADTPRYGDGASYVELEILDRAQNPWQYAITSPYYEPIGATPAYWTAHDIIEDLFTRFSGFAPGDFNLDPAGDWTLLGPIQFSQEAVAVAAAKCLQPNGYRVFFDYDGDISSALLVPAGDPTTWPVAMVIPAEAIRTIDGPVSSEPTATRVRAVGGDADSDMVNIGDASVLGTTHFHVDFTSGLSYEANGDVYYAIKVSNFHYHLWFQGQQGETWRAHASHVGPRRYIVGDDTAFYWVSLPAVIHTDPASDHYHAGMDRHVVEVSLQLVDGGGGPPTEWDFEVDVLGHKYEVTRPKAYAQRWDDALIAIWGDRAYNIENPLIQHWNYGATVAEQEVEIATLSTLRATVSLQRLDLRPEPGDVVTIENPRGANFDLWIRQVGHTAGRTGAYTSLDGYVIS